MKWLTIRHRIIAIVVVLMVILLGLLPVRVQTGDDFRTPMNGATAIPVAPLYNNATVTQEFPASGKAIASLSLQLATYQRRNSGTLFLTVRAYRDAEWRIIGEQAVDKRELVDNLFHVFTFQPPLEAQGAEQISFTIQVDGDDKQAISWWINPDWQPTNYRLLVNGVPRGGTGNFIVAYEQRTGLLFQTLPEIWGRVSIFLDPVWRLVLLMSILLIVPTSIIILLRDP